MGKNSKVNKQLVAMFWLNWRKCGSVSYLFSLIIENELSEMIYMHDVTHNVFVTCFHEFQIYQFCSQIFSYFLLKQGRILLLRSKIFISNYLFSQKRQFAAPLKVTRKFSGKKNIDSEFVKTCHEQVNRENLACIAL
jgi:hypothetical protein